MEFTGRPSRHLLEEGFYKFSFPAENWLPSVLDVLHMWQVTSSVALIEMLPLWVLELHQLNGSCLGRRVLQDRDETLSKRQKLGSPLHSLELGEDPLDTDFSKVTGDRVG